MGCASAQQRNKVQTHTLCKRTSPGFLLLGDKSSILGVVKTGTITGGLLLRQVASAGDKQQSGDKSQPWRCVE